MAREPFNPDLIGKSDEQQELPAMVRLLSVSELTQMVRTALLDGLPAEVHVVGQISNVSRPSSGHMYFTLKDPDSEVRCVMWRQSARSLKFRPDDGMEVMATGHVDVYAPRGQYQLYVRRLEPRGVGALELAFRQLCEKLRQEGLFEVSHKKPLPQYPQTIAIVTSPTGAAIRDIIRTIGDRYPCVRLLVVPVQVQGEAAAGQIAAAIGRLNDQRDRLGGIDVMIVGRGGGSLEDLWAFNEEAVARAIFDSEIPMVSAVGHETDTTVSDLVADVRAATPTAAAELVVPVLAEVSEQFERQAGRASRAVQSLLALVGSRLSAAGRCEFLRDPVGRIRQSDQQVDEVVARLRLVTGGRVDMIRRRLHAWAMTLARMGPQEYVARRGRDLLDVIHRLYRAQWTGYRCAERELDGLGRRLARVWPVRVLARYEAVLDQLGPRLERTVSGRVRGSAEQLGFFGKRLEAGGYKRILHRGFSITRRDDGSLVTSPQQVASGVRIETETADGRFDSEVIDGSDRSSGDRTGKKS